MRKILSILLLSIPVGLWGQVSNPSVIYTGSAPTGACLAAPPIEVLSTTGAVCTCNSGTWSCTSSGGGGGVSSLNGDGTIINNVSSTGAVTLTLANTPTGTGGVVLATSPTLITPLLGTPTSGVITNLTGTCTACTANTVTSLASPPAIGGTTPAAITGTNITANSNFLGGSFEATSTTNNVTFQGGQNASSGSTLGSVTVRGANNATNGGGGNATLQGGSSATGQQGWAVVNESYTTASALSTTFNVVSATSTADQVAATGLGATTGVVGIAQTVGGTNTQIYVASYGKTTVRFDGTPTIGDTACAPPLSTGTAGLAHDNGTTACTTSSLIGVVTGQVSGSGSGATATVLLKLN